MLEEYLSQNESRTLEFKENAKSLSGIVKTVIAFANTSGGILLIGVKNKTKEIVGISDPLQEEERIANALSDNIAPLLIPDIEIHTWRDRELIVIRVPHVAGPFYLKPEGAQHGVYIRFGSTNRIADDEMLTSLKLFSENRSWDELPSPKGTLDEKAIGEAFAIVKKYPTKRHLEALGIFTEHLGKSIMTQGGVLLFGLNRLPLYPDALIRCARFMGITKEKIIDSLEIVSSLPQSVTTKEAAKIWKVSDRTARTRLKRMIESGRLQRVATSEKDPLATFIIRK